MDKVAGIRARAVDAKLRFLCRYVTIDVRRHIHLLYMAREQARSQAERKTDHIVVAADDASDQMPSVTLNCIGSGLVERLAASNVPAKECIGEPAHANLGLESAPLLFLSDADGNGGNDGVTASPESAQHVICPIGRAGLPENVAFNRDYGISCDHNGGRVAATAVQTLLVSQIKTVRHRVFAGPRRPLVDMSGIDDKRNPEMSQQHAAARGTRGEYYAGRSRIVRHSAWYVCG